MKKYDPLSTEFLEMSNPRAQELTRGEKGRDLGICLGGVIGGGAFALGGCLLGYEFAEYATKTMETEIYKTGIKGLSSLAGIVTVGSIGYFIGGLTGMAIGRIVGEISEDHYRNGKK